MLFRKQHNDKMCLLASASESLRNSKLILWYRIFSHYGCLGLSYTILAILSVTICHLKLSFCVILKYNYFLYPTRLIIVTANVPRQILTWCNNNIIKHLLDTFAYHLIAKSVVIRWRNRVWFSLVQHFYLDTWVSNALPV